MTVLSSNVKVTLLNRDIFLQGVDSRRSHYTVQSYSYSLVRNVDTDKVVEGSGKSLYFTVKLKVGTRHSLTPFYESLTQSFPHSFTLLFNASYDENGNVIDRDDAMVVEGYTVGIDESYERSARDSAGEQVSLKMNILVKKIIYEGENDNIVHLF